MQSKEKGSRVICVYDERRCVLLSVCVLHDLFCRNATNEMN